MGAAGEYGMSQEDWDGLSSEDQAALDEYFEEDTSSTDQDESSDRAENCGGGVAGELDVSKLPKDIDPRIVPWIQKSNAKCPDYPAPVQAAQLFAESGFRPDATGPSVDRGDGVYEQAQGIAQFMPSTWTGRGIDAAAKEGAESHANTAKPDNAKDAYTIGDAIMAQNAYMCDLLKTAKSKCAGSDPIQLALAAYNAGGGNVFPPDEDCNIPNFPETQKYVKKIMKQAEEWTLPGTGGGGLTDSQIKQVIAYAEKAVGKGYSQDPDLRFGPDYYDCSGLIHKAFGAAGISLATITNTIADDKKVNIVHKGSGLPATARAGDIIFMNYTDDGHVSQALGSNVSHVALYVGNDTVIEAANARTGVVKRKVDASAIVGVGRVGGEWVRPAVGPVTSNFGPRSGGHHEGLDIGAAKGSDVKAVAAGTVTWAGDKGDGYGNYVMIRHDGFATLYGHMLDGLKVKKGDVISAGTVLGLVGSTGNSTGPHLHLNYCAKEADSCYRSTPSSDPRPVLAEHGITFQDA
ncbi:MAG: peptidoglycan DD-metalloendopeptidase family protein [Corynebacteriales bacterium]|nr:peptidoglycan DD-metalloendopeptidase family protein [Mycobacteriales bacterium]